MTVQGKCVQYYCCLFYNTSQSPLLGIVEITIGYHLVNWSCLTRPSNRLPARQVTPPKTPLTPPTTPLINSSWMTAMRVAKLYISIPHFTCVCRIWRVRKPVESVSKYKVWAAAVNMRGRPCIEARDAWLTPVLAVHTHHPLVVTKQFPHNPRHLNIYSYISVQKRNLGNPSSKQGIGRGHKRGCYKAASNDQPSQSFVPPLVWIYTPPPLGIPSFPYSLPWYISNFSTCRENHWSKAELTCKFAIRRSSDTHVYVVAARFRLRMR